MPSISRGRSRSLKERRAVWEWWFKDNGSGIRRAA
jgi:hypothetical protein